jgi:hypothetical protein
MTNETTEPLEPIDDSADTDSEENDDSAQDLDGRYPDDDAAADDVAPDPSPGQPSSAIRPPQSG